ALDGLPRLRCLRLHGLGFFGSLPDYVSHLARLETLELHYCLFEEPSIHALLAAPELVGLRRLLVTGFRPNELRTFHSLVRHAHRPELRELCVDQSIGLPAATVRAVLDSGAFPRLICLS